MINDHIDCDSCGTVGATYSGFNPLQCKAIKDLLCTKGWSFRSNPETDEGRVLCPVCFRQYGENAMVLVAYDDSHAWDRQIAAKLVKPADAPGVSQKLVRDGSTVLYVEGVRWEEE